MADEISKKDQIDTLFKFYQEHTTHARHHETQRSTTSTIMVAIAAGVAGLIKSDGIADNLTFWLALFLIAIGLFGAAFVYKQYERYRLHTERAKRYRNALDELLPDRKHILPETCFGLSSKGQKFLEEPLGTKPVKALKRVADADHASKYTVVSKYSLHLGWVLVQLCIVLLGLILAIITFPGEAGLFERKQAATNAESGRDGGTANPGAPADGSRRR